MLLAFDFRGEARFETTNPAGDGGVSPGLSPFMMRELPGVWNLLRSHRIAAYAGSPVGEPSRVGAKADLIGGMSRLRNGFSQWRTTAVNLGSFRSLHALGSGA